MAFLEELSKTLTDTGKEVATKAKAITESIQLKTQISGEKTKLEEAYAVIGKLYYEANLEPEENYGRAFEAVKACRERIAALEIELTQNEGSRVCAECGAKVPKDSMYCGKCGAPIKEPVENVAPEEADQEVAGQEQAAAEEEPNPIGVPKAKEDDFVPTEEY